MSYLLDTCAISELAAPKPNPGFVAWLDDQPDEALFLSVLTVGELIRGVELLGPGPKRRNLERWLAELRTSYRDRLLPVDEAVAALWGIYSARAKESGNALHAVDGLLAATAVRSALSVVTRNTRDFRSVGVTVIDPWT
ncbi:type II toxin-antitoxin system VapC family toxin [Pendulispora brunnea]|uniref:Ribonuclease VapC n=1 Tax=Pendulispora brunnea TaxID=2905690 RepID=A0ABZ2KHT9_9BACT